MQDWLRSAERGGDDGVNAPVELAFLLWMGDVRELSEATGLPIPDILAMAPVDVERLMIASQARADFRRYRADQLRQRETLGGA